MSLQPPPQARFYNIYSCDNLNFTGKYSPDSQDVYPYIGGAYLANGNGLLVVGSTKVSSGMFNPATFYKSLSQGKDFGQSFLDWWVSTHQSRDEAEFRKWFYGMSVLGIPAIGISQKSIEIELISAPVVTGPVNGITGTTYAFAAGGSVDNLGWNIQYLFNWGDGTSSGWLTVGTTSASKTWSSAGTYTVRAQARSSVSQNIISGWSNSLAVVIIAEAESVSQPTISGPSSGIVTQDYTFTASGAVDSLNHPVQYFFDWGDGSNSGWLAVGITTDSKSWSFAKTHTVRVQARSSINQNVVSVWSALLTITIAAETVSTPTLTGPSNGKVGQNYVFTTSAVDNLGSPVQYFFDWGDGTNSGWLPTETTITPKIWQLAGTYSVKVQARSVTNQVVVSDWSSPLTVVITAVLNPKIIIKLNVGAITVGVVKKVTVATTDENSSKLNGVSIAVNLPDGQMLIGMTNRQSKAGFIVKCSVAGQAVVTAQKSGFEIATMTIAVNPSSAKHKKSTF